jgi:O-acetylserine/cysteine efflux transporter
LKPTDVLLAIAVPTIWGIGFTLAKAGLAQFPPVMLVGLRFGLTAMLLVWFVRPPWRHMGRIALVAAVGGTLQYSLVYMGLSGLDASTATLVIQLEVPLALLVAAIFLKEHLGWRRVTGMVVAFAGLMFIVGEPRVQESIGPLLLVVAAALAFAVAQVMVRALGPVGGLTLIAWVSVWSAPQYLAVSLALESGHWEALTTAAWKDWAIVLYQGIAMNCLGYALWYHLLGKYPVNSAMPFLLLGPVTTMAAAVLILGEQPTWLILAGGVVIISGVAICTVELGRFLPARPRPSAGG